MRFIKHILPLALLFFINIQGAFAQNLVPNGGFEYYTRCPSGYSQIDSAYGWWMYTNGTSDLFRTCATVSVGIPSNAQGYQHAAQGGGYAGAILYMDNQSYKEYVAGEIDSMTSGRIYEVSMSVSLADYSGYAVQDIGMFFYKNRSNYIWTNSALTNYTPQIDFARTTLIGDTQNWVRLIDTMVADSSYDKIIIGSFYQNFTLTKGPNHGGNNNAAYYYYDSIVIKRLLFLSVGPINDSAFCAGDTLTVPYNAFGDYDTSNKFIIQLSDKSGDFGSPINIGEYKTDTTGSILCTIPSNISTGSNYRIRALSTSSIDTSVNFIENIKIGNIDSSVGTISSNSPVCAGSTLSLYAIVSAPTVFSWTGPNSFSASTGFTSVSNTTSSSGGDYHVNIKFYGCEYNDTIPVTIKIAPQNLVATTDTLICEGDTINLSATNNTTGVTYGWTGPNSFSASIPNTYIPNSSASNNGVYTVSASINGCTNTDTVSVLVRPNPTQTTLITNSPICEGDTLYLNSTSSTSGATYEWSNAYSYSSAQKDDTLINATSSLTGWYKMSINLNGCYLYDSTSVNVYTIPIKPNLSYDSLVCVGDTLRLFANSIAGAGFSWSGPNGFSSIQKNPRIANASLASAGIYSAIANNNGCVSTPSTLSVTINPVPFVTVLSNKDTICSGEQIQYSALAGNGGAKMSYHWYKNGQIISGANTSTYSSSSIQFNDVIRCDIVDSTKCAVPYRDTGNDVQIVVMPWLTPSVSISANPVGPVPQDSFVTFTATAVNAGNSPLYQWKRNGSDILGATSDTWSANTLNDHDSVSVEIESTYKCPQPKTAGSNGIVVTILSGIEELKGKLKDVTLYPNPNNGMFVLKGQVLSDDIKASIYNATGQMVFNETINAHSGSVAHKFNVSTLAVGSYTLVLDVEGVRSVISFSVSH